MSTTPAQRNALRLAKGGHYHYHPDSGSARAVPHVPGQTPIIARRTLNVLIDEGLVAWDRLYWGRLTITDKGRQVLDPATKEA